jgi:hypothetical protein
MNAVDAGAHICRITLTREGFAVTDDGAGFGSYDDVMVSFKRIGKAHKEDAPTFGRFGMGRGQIMPWGRIKWTSGTHRMTTDLRAYDGFEYAEGPEKPGCMVEGSFYEPPARYEFLRIQEELVSQCRFIDGNIDIVINNRRVNAADDDVWDEETEDYRIRWYHSRGDFRHIRIYNQGVFISNYPDMPEGLGGDVVAKKAMTLNMARNSIDPKDPVYQRISARISDKIREHRKGQSKRKAMTEDKRQPLIKALIHPSADIAELMFEEWSDEFAQEGHKVPHAPLLRDCRGRYHRFDSLDHRPLTVVPEGREREGESASIQNLAVPITRTELRNWGVESGYDLIEKYNDSIAPRLWRLAFPQHSPLQFRHMMINGREVDFEVIAKGLNTDATLLKNKDLTSREAAARNAFDYGSGLMAKRIGNIDRASVRKRRVVLGESLSADGWTDTTSFIAIHRKMVDILERGPHGATQIALLMLHEYVHDEDNPDCNEHSEIFYERFHDLSSNYSGNEIIGNVSRSIWQRYLTELNKKGLGLPKAAEGHPEANRTFKYTVQLGGGGLSVMAKQLLEKARLDYTLRGRKLIIRSNIDYLSDRMDAIDKWICDHIPSELGLESLSAHRKRTIDHRNFDDPVAHQVLAEHREHVANSWAKHNGASAQTYLAACKMTRDRYTRSPQEKLIQFFIADPDTDAQRYEADPRWELPKHTLGAPGYHLKLTPWEMRGIGQYGAVVRVDRASIQSNRSARAALVIQRVKEAISGIVDPDERAEVIEQIQSIDLSNEMEDGQLGVN